MRRGRDDEITKVQKWFQKSVAFNGEPYAMDREQIAAVIDDSLNTIVVARAGSGKTRTIVAKIVFLIKKRNVRPEEIISFVFNANAAQEINRRLRKMTVDGEPVIGDRVKIATTFHAFARKIVYTKCKGGTSCKMILADNKQDYVEAIMWRMMREKKWQEKITEFIKAEQPNAPSKKLVTSSEAAIKSRISDLELIHCAKMMTTFIDRAQQKFLGSDTSLEKYAKEYSANLSSGCRERIFLELGAECYRRYHWYLLGAPNRLPGFSVYGTDFNLLISWASKLMAARRAEATEWLANKKYILVDEYQDFSQLFLSAIIAMRQIADKAHLFAVGDDWQAINRFAGSDVTFFKEFSRFFPEDNAKYEITTNYRCDKMVVNKSRKFIQKSMAEKGNFRAFSKRAGDITIVNPTNTDCRYAGPPYNRGLVGEDHYYYALAKWMLRKEPKERTVKYLKLLIQIIKKNRRASSVLLLHRNNETNIDGVNLTRLSKALGRGLEKLRILSISEYQRKVRIMTMHKSKGLEAEVVVIMEADEGIIPSRHSETYLYAMFGESTDTELEDQKRLFYVAMTRAKRRLYILTENRKDEGFARFL